MSGCPSGVRDLETLKIEPGTRASPGGRCPQVTGPPGGLRTQDTGGVAPNPPGMRLSLLSRLLLVGFLLALALPVAARSTRHFNSRFGFEIRVPTGFVAEPEPANQDGRTFLHRSSGAELRVWGWNNALDETLPGALERSRDSIPGPIAHQQQGRNWYVLSWIEGKNIFYEKTFLGAGSGASFRLVYPLARKAAFDPIVTTLEKSFRPGDLSRAH